MCRPEKLTDEERLVFTTKPWSYIEEEYGIETGSKGTERLFKLSKNPQSKKDSIFNYSGERGLGYYEYEYQIVTVETKYGYDDVFYNYTCPRCGSSNAGGNGCDIVRIRTYEGDYGPALKTERMRPKCLNDIEMAVVRPRYVCFEPYHLLDGNRVYVNIQNKIKAQTEGINYTPSHSLYPVTWGLGWNAVIKNCGNGFIDPPGINMRHRMTTYLYDHIVRDIKEHYKEGKKRQRYLGFVMERYQLTRAQVEAIAKELDFG